MVGANKYIMYLLNSRRKDIFRFGGNNFHSGIVAFESNQYFDQGKPLTGHFDFIS